MGSAFMHGWVTLPDGEMYVDHGVPRQVRTDGETIADVERLVGAIADITGLHVTLGRWEMDEDAGDWTATIHVDAQDVAEVLKRLARASAETFYDRYRKPIDASDTDFDDEACAQDFNVALGVCGLRWDQLDERAMRVTYRRALHQAVDEIAAHPD